MAAPIPERDLKTVGELKEFLADIPDATLITIPVNPQGYLYEVHISDGRNFAEGAIILTAGENMIEGEG